MNHVPFTTDHKTLIQMATEAIKGRTTVNMTLPEDWKRPRDFPLPNVAHKHTRQREYKPQYIIDWVKSEINILAASQRMSRPDVLERLAKGRQARGANNT